jgi:ATP-dependent 26S proteasome regulatory subunit
MPTISDVFDMLELHLSKVPKNEDINMTELAGLLVELNATGADVQGVCRDACSRVIREAAQHLTPPDLVVSQSDFIAALEERQK